MESKIVGNALSGLRCLISVASLACASSSLAADASIELTTVFSGATRGLELGVEYEPSDQLTLGASAERRWRVPNSAERASGYELEVEWVPLNPIPSISLGASLSYAYGTEREAVSPKLREHEAVLQAVVQWQAHPIVKVKAKAGPGFEKNNDGWDQAGKYDLSLSVDLTRTLEFEWSVADGDYASPTHKVDLGWLISDAYEVTIGYAFRKDDPLWSITIERSW